MRNLKASRIAPRAVEPLWGPERPITRSALLSCRHVQEFTPGPSLGDLVYCRQCKDYFTVTAIQSDYRAKCRQCTFNRPFGRAAFARDNAARKHGDKTGHTVDCSDGSKLDWTYSPGSGGQTVMGDDPPF